MYLFQEVIFKSVEQFADKIVIEEHRCLFEAEFRHFFEKEQADMGIHNKFTNPRKQQFVVVEAPFVFLSDFL